MKVYQIIKNDYSDSEIVELGEGGHRGEFGIHTRRLNMAFQGSDGHPQKCHHAGQIFRLLLKISVVTLHS